MENKKPFYTRWWFILFVILVAGGALSNIISGDEEQTVVNEPVETDQSEEVEETTSDPEEVEEESEQVISLDQELMFGEFTINFEELEIEDDKAVVTFRWLNQAADGDKYFFALAGIDVTQGEEILEEVSGAFDANNQNTSDMYFPNAENGEVEATLEYGLVDTETPIEITVVPYNEYDESESITIDIN